MSELSKEMQDLIQKQVDEIASAKKEAQTPAVQPRKEDGFKIDSTLLVAVVIFVVAIGGLFFMMKNRNQQQSPMMSFRQQGQVYPSQPFPQQYQNSPYNPAVQSLQSVNVNDIKAYLDPWIDQKLYGINQRVDGIEYRTWLLGIANNENAVVSRRLAETMNRTDLASKFMLLDKDWHFNKLPEFQQISEEDRRHLLRYVNANYNQYKQRKVTNTTQPSVYVQPNACDPVVNIQQQYQPQVRYVYPQQRVYCSPPVVYSNRVCR